MARNSTYTQAMADEICRRIASGETLRDICMEKAMPTAATVQYWRHTVPAFADQYNSARQSQAETIFDEILEIADTVEVGERVVETEEETKVYRGDMLGHRELKIKARQWILPRISKKMTEKAIFDHQSSDGSMSPALMTEQERATRIAAIYANALRRKAAKEAEDGDLDGSDLC